MFFIAYGFKGQVHVFAGRVNILSHSSCRTSTILKYYCALRYMFNPLKTENSLAGTVANSEGSEEMLHNHDLHCSLRLEIIICVPSI